MKVNFTQSHITVAIFITLFLGGCYSAEFYPEDDYPNLRRADVEEVEIRVRPPSRPYERLGTLIVRDPSADLQNENFRRYLRGEARRRGAEGAWVTARDFTTNTLITGSPTDANQYVETGNLTLESGVVTVILYNYTDP